MEHVLRNQRDPELVRLYTQLECAYGADLSTVKKQYRALMRRYHPDRHTQSPEKQAIATELTQKLTQAYHELTKRLH
ncbi:MAG: J domain-containing protein [Microbacteriaceae bacterium]|nr:J domain-containing protein [Microbacteriaceae bacterium]